MNRQHGQVWRRIALYAGIGVVIFAILHLLYIAHIRPTADAMIDAARAAGSAAPRSIYVVLRDIEQEVCLVLMCWGVVISLIKMFELSEQWDYFGVLARAPQRDLEQAAQSSDQPLVRAFADSLARFHDKEGDIHEAREALRSHIDALARNLEAGNSITRYLIWVVPSIGFVGTVRGIGQALGEADKALAGDIASMTANLGVAFNSTLVALLASIVMMFFMQLLQSTQDRLVIDVEAECEMRIRREARAQQQQAAARGEDTAHA